ncbi:hypothetical protein [Synergistes jonesii]|uniref:hypothetical protein n=1 Tax=Synergistes jonesii TaxID=2754 RepID=UPI00248DD9EC|nr:hypothetical protein [Synergistes jonesii]
MMSIMPARGSFPAAKHRPYILPAPRAFRQARKQRHIKDAAPAMFLPQGGPL